jgi:hypothetical protein
MAINDNQEMRQTAKKPRFCETPFRGIGLRR